jgi:hypothetical protein
VRRTALALLVPLLLTACSGNKTANTRPTEAPSPTRSCPIDGPSIPEVCVSDTPETPASFPADPSKIPPVTLEQVAGRLGGANNRDDATKRTATFTVTVLKGSRIGSVVLCLGSGSVSIDTVPASKAFQSITCDADPVVPSELSAEDNIVLDKDTTFTATVTADKASRWDVAVYATTKKPGF